MTQQWCGCGGCPDHAGAWCGEASTQTVVIRGANEEGVFLRVRTAFCDRCYLAALTDPDPDVEVVSELGEEHDAG